MSLRFHHISILLFELIACLSVCIQSNYCSALCNSRLHMDDQNAKRNDQQMFVFVATYCATNTPRNYVCVFNVGRVWKTEVVRMYCGCLRDTSHGLTSFLCRCHSPPLSGVYPTFRPCGICSGQNVLGTDFSPVTFYSRPPPTPRHYHTTNDPYSSLLAPPCGI